MKIKNKRDHVQFATWHKAWKAVNFKTDYCLLDMEFEIDIGLREKGRWFMQNSLKDWWENEATE